MTGRLLPGWLARAAALTLWVAPLLTHVATADAHAHGALRRSSPAAGAHLSQVPRQLRLAFSEPVELAVARLRLMGPNGAEVALGPLQLAPDSARVLVAEIAGPLSAGSYTVRWQIASADGHPVRGDFAFAIAPGAQGLAPPDPAPAGPPMPADPSPASRHDAADLPGGPGFDAGSPLYVAVRWLAFVGLVGTVGAVAFRLAVLRRLPRRDGVWDPQLTAVVAARTARLGALFAGLVLVAALLRLLAQWYALQGSATIDAGQVGSMLRHTTWGRGWMVQTGSALLALLGLMLARRDQRRGWILASLGVAGLAVGSGLSGHAAGVPRLGAVAVLADALHLIGAGGWLGSLVFVVLVGIPAAMRRAPERGAAVAALVGGFSPTALCFAGIVVATGVFASWLHLDGLPSLWGTDYGRTLLLKLGVLAAVFGTGAYNWKRVLPSLGSEAGAGVLRRSATVELAVGALVLAVTAVLVATAPPRGADEEVSVAESASPAR